MWKDPVHSKKLSEARKKRVTTEETKRKMVESRRGYTHSEETKKKMSNTRLSLNLVGEKSSNYKHGFYNHESYGRWWLMVSRCHNPGADDYENYGGQGIIVCQEWRSNPEGLIAFCNYIDAVLGPKPGPDYQLDRIDTYGNYEPGNIQWLSAEENNKKRKRNQGSKKGKKYPHPIGCKCPVHSGSSFGKKYKKKKVEVS